VLFDQAMEASAVERLELEADLRRALDKGEFRVFYQPTVSLSDGR
jgi:sensor c-di-GMP phosphodiesterase-like protein